ncbi:MAG: hypothetical protein AB7N71_03055 [Phycisphaerae bacterium]
MTKKWVSLGALLFGGATLFQSGCLGAFGQGFFNSGWPTNNRVINVALDVLQEELFG